MPKALFTLLFIISTFMAGAQSTVPEKIVAALDSFSFSRPQEKAYVQTDRNEYIAGETIWFKTYVLLNERPTILSRVVYTDLLDASGRIVEKNMLKLSKGTAGGSMYLKPELAPGNYYLRTYTLWMLNFPDFVTEQKITVRNNRNSALKKITSAPDAALNIGFFPEGGNLVAGLKSIVAFKALDENGAPAAISGDLFNAKKEKLLSFKSIHDGMGSFELLPNTGESYSAVIRFAGGRQKTVSLPAVKAEGIILSVDNSNLSKTFVKVERSETNKDKYNNLLVVAQINNRVAYMGKLNIDEGLDAVAISKKNLPAGIMQVTVLTEDGSPLAERIVFVANHLVGDALLQGSVVDFEKRKKNVFTLDAREFSGLQAAVSVTNADAEADGFRPGILSSFLLSSDIRGDIHDAGYYFKDKEPGTLQDLDLVMRINGWRRFALEDILQNKYSPLRYPLETGLSLTGKVLQSNGRTALRSGKINLIIKGEDSTNILSEAKTNEGAVFVVDQLEFQKEAVIYYQGTNTAKTEAVVSVQIDSAYFDTLNRAGLNTGVIQTMNSPAPYVQQLLQEKQKKDSAGGKLLSEVVVRTRKRSETDSLNQVYASDIFYGSDQTLALNPNINYYDVWQFLRMSVPGIVINRNDSGIEVKFSRYEGLDMFSVNGDNSSVQFFLNEVPVDISLIDGLDPSDVALIKIYKGVTGIALGATRGAISVYTVKGKTGRDWRQKGFDYIRKSGYSVKMEFYEMDYSKTDPATKNPDTRATLYWNPEIKIIDGRANIEFYNDDHCRKFRIVAEGVDTNGRLLRAEKLVQ